MHTQKKTVMGGTEKNDNRMFRYLIFTPFVGTKI